MGRAGKPVRRAVSFVIRNPRAPEQVLAVLRPPDDPELPDVWGLPAASERPGESAEAAVRRAGLEKLGVELEVGRELTSGRSERRGYALEMRLFEAVVKRGEPHVPQPHPEVTQYREWRWADAELFLPAADLGSLCCRLFLESEGGRAGRRGS
ncbi:MAG: NUDIX hydrolase [Gemmatimonadetes bacterium]|nr:NUDIX hydrolase [Gemmatimonadota bacterium]